MHPGPQQELCPLQPQGQRWQCYLVVPWGLGLCLPLLQPAGLRCTGLGLGGGHLGHLAPDPGLRGALWVTRQRLGFLLKRPQPMSGTHTASPRASRAPILALTHHPSPSHSGPLPEGSPGPVGRGASWVQAKGPLASTVHISPPLIAVNGASGPWCPAQPARRHRLTPQLVPTP